jgi:hypothetical protein
MGMSRITMLLVGVSLVVAACGTADDTVGATDTTVGPSSPEATVTSTTSPPPTSTSEAPASTSTEPVGSTTTTTLAVDLVTSTTKPVSGTPRDLPDLTVPPGIDPLSVGQVAFAVANLATFLGIDQDQITVIGFAEVVWNDGSLGCPQPGFAYPQVLVDGMQILLEYDGEIFDYHAGGDRDPFLCVDPIA